MYDNLERTVHKLALICWNEKNFSVVESALLCKFKKLADYLYNAGYNKSKIDREKLNSLKQNKLDCDFKNILDDLFNHK